VANDTTAGTPDFADAVLNWLSTGSDSIPVSWPRVANGTDAITYDVIRMTTAGGIEQNLPYPYNADAGWIGRDVRICGERADASGGVRGRVGVQLYGYGIVFDFDLYDRIGDYAGNLAFWPGSLVSVNKSVRVDAEVNNPVGAGLYGNALQVANQCSDYGTASPGGYTTCLASMTGHVGSGVQNQSATVLTDGGSVGGGQQLSKGG